MPRRGLWPALALLLPIAGGAALRSGCYTRGRPPPHLRQRPCAACIAGEPDGGQSSAPLATRAPAAAERPAERSAGLAAEPPTPQQATPPQASPQQTTLRAVVALNLVTILWGSQHAVIKGLVELTDSPALVNAVRFDLAALLALPWLPRPRLALPNTSPDTSPDTAPGDGAEAAAAVRATWAGGAELGLWTFAGFSLQAIGLQLTSASRSAFLLYLNVKLVPVLAFLLYGRSVPARTWASAAIAVLGTGLLTYDGNPPNAGDAWSLAAALSSAFFILRLEAISRDS